MGVVSITMRIITLLALATCLLQFFQPTESVAPLVVLGGVAASVKIAGYLQGLWKTHTKNHCWPKNIDAGFYSGWEGNSDPADTLCEKTWWLRAPWQDPYAVKCTRGTFEGIDCDNFKHEMIFDVNYKYGEQMAKELQMKS